MSDTTNNWELGVVSFYDSFEEFDRYTTLASDYSAGGGTLSLNSDLCSDYTGSPYYLVGQLQYGSTGSNMPGNEIIIGPSSDSSFEGAVEKVTIESVSGTSITLKSSTANGFIALPASNFDSGDQVLIRTCPLGWTPHSGMATHTGVMPIKRYDDRYKIYSHLSDIPGIDDYNMDNQYAVRMFCNRSTVSGAEDSQYIRRYSDLNSFSARTIAYRMSCYYRINKYVASGPDTEDLSAKIEIGLVKADKNNVGSSSLTSADRLFQKNANTSNWTYHEAFMTNTSEYVTNNTWVNDTTKGAWNFIGASDPDSAEANKCNRFWVNITLYKGRNTAFDVDDLLIEHASGTSDEAEGYYTIDDYPEAGTVSVQSIDPWRRTRLANGAMKSITSQALKRPKYVLSAQFRDVPVSIYEDMRVLETWSQRGHLIALRPKLDGLPHVLVGEIKVSRQAPTTWDLSYCTFTIQFAEA